MEEMVIRKDAARRQQDSGDQSMRKGRLRLSQSIVKKRKRLSQRVVRREIRSMSQRGQEKKEIVSS